MQNRKDTYRYNNVSAWMNLRNVAQQTRKGNGQDPFELTSADYINDHIMRPRERMVGRMGAMPNIHQIINRRGGIV